MTIKRTPEDFQVEEVLKPELIDAIRAEKTRFALFTLSKESLSTPEAVAQVSGKLRVAPGRIAFAGLKDKHAATTQHFTIREPAERASTLPLRDRGEHWQIERLGWIEDELTPGAIAANRFAIMIRDLTREDSKLMTQVLELLSVARSPKNNLPSAIRVVNYFGDQRFGSARHGEGFLAKNLIAGDFEGALKLMIATPAERDRRAQQEFKQQVARKWGKWSDLLKTPSREPHMAAVKHLAAKPGDFRGAFASLPYFDQQIAVEAYQSQLWNTIARRLVEQTCSGDGDMIEADDPFGNLLFPSAINIPGELVELNLPVMGRRTQLVDPWREVASEVLAEEGIMPADLHIPGLKKPYFGEAPRRLFVDATAIALGNPQTDELSDEPERICRRLVMQLPRGSYATVVLRALGQ